MYAGTLGCLILNPDYHSGQCQIIPFGTLSPCCLPEFFDAFDPVKYREKTLFLKLSQGTSLISSFSLFVNKGVRIRCPAFDEPFFNGRRTLLDHQGKLALTYELRKVKLFRAAGNKM